jgi:hypothetical protein
MLQSQKSAGWGGQVLLCLGYALTASGPYGLEGVNSV